MKRLSLVCLLLACASPCCGEPQEGTSDPSVVVRRTESSIPVGSGEPPARLVILVDTNNVGLPRGTRVWWILDRIATRASSDADRISWTGSVGDGGECRVPAPPEDGRTGWLSWWVTIGEEPVLVESGMYDEYSPGWFVDRDGDTVQAALPDRWTELVIHDESGSPIANARVSLTISRRGAPISELGSTNADEQGRARLGPLSYGPFWADVAATGFAPARVSLHQGVSADAPGEVDVVLSRGYEVTVRMQPGRGRAAALTQLTYEYIGADGRPAGTTWSAICGRERVARLVVPINASVRVSAPESANGSVTIPARDFAEPKQLRLWIDRHGQLRAE